MEYLSLETALSAAMAARGRGEECVIATVVANRTDVAILPAARLLIMASGEVAGRLAADLDAIVTSDALDQLRQHRSKLRSYRRNDGGWAGTSLSEGELEVYYEVLHRPPRLIIVGGGHIALPLAGIAKVLDFEVIVVDDRREYANRERFPQVDEIRVGLYRNMLANIEIHSDTYIVLVTRGHVHDQACLEQTLDSPAAYIGMIGSKRRVRTVMEHLLERGADPRALQHVYAPVGLDIRAETPAEIAVAIMGEIVNVRRGGGAPSLSLGERLRV